MMIRDKSGRSNHGNNYFDCWKSTVTMTSRDLDGDGPNVPVVTVSGDLLVNTTYSGAVSFLNESVTPVDDITVEVKEEGLEHQLFFQAAEAIEPLPMQMQM
jgi:hypothetical protein